MAKKKENPAVAAKGTKSPAPAAKSAPATKSPAPAAKSVPAAKTPAPAAKSAPAAKTPAPAAKSVPAAKTPAPAAKSAPAAKTPAPAAKSVPAAKTPAPAAKSAPAAKTPAPAAKSAPAAKTPAAKSAPVAKPAAETTPPVAAAPDAQTTALTGKAAWEARIAERAAAKKSMIEVREANARERQAATEARKAERNAALQADAASRAALLADQKAKVDALKAEKAAAFKAAADSRAAKLAEQKTLNEARAAERVAATKAAADARAEKLAQAKADAEAKKAEVVKPVKPVNERKPVAQPSRPASRPVPAAKAGAQTVAVPAFDISLSLKLDRNWEGVMQNAMRNAATAASQQLNDLLKMPPNLDVVATRALDGVKKRVIRALDRAIATSLIRLLDPQSLDFPGLEVSEDGARAIVPTRSVPSSDFIKNRINASYRDLIAVIAQADAPLKQFLTKKPEIVLMFGDTLPSDYYFSGTFRLSINYEKPEESGVVQETHMFAKRGKKMGPQLKLSLQHFLNGNAFEGKLNADFPITKQES